MAKKELYYYDRKTDSYKRINGYVLGDTTDNLVRSLMPNINFSLEENGDLFVDVDYNNLPEPEKPTPNEGQTTKLYNVVWGNAQPSNAGDGRGYLEYSTISGFGKLHLDIRLKNPSGNGTVIATLPNNSPIPTRLLENSINANNNSIYLEPNSRDIKGWGVPANTRYILDIVGFWKEVK